MKHISDNILFRAKLKNKNQLQTVLGMDLVNDFLFLGNGKKIDKVPWKNVEELMRTTGLKDYDGVPIFFGDILLATFTDKNDQEACHYGSALVVETMSNGAGLLMDWLDEDPRFTFATDEGGCVCDLWEDDDLWHVEVIGNKYEHKHLLYPRSSPYASNAKKGV